MQGGHIAAWHATATAREAWPEAALTPRCKNRGAVVKTTEKPQDVEDRPVRTRGYLPWGLAALHRDRSLHRGLWSPTLMNPGTRICVTKIDSQAEACGCATFRVAKGANCRLDVCQEPESGGRLIVTKYVQMMAFAPSPMGGTAFTSANRQSAIPSV